MESYSFRDFDEFSASVRDVDAAMMLPGIPKRRLWSTNHVYLPHSHLQLGRLGSGNVVEGESGGSGYLIYLPLTETCEYAGNGVTLSRDSFLILEPGCDFCVRTKDEHDWCSVSVPSRQLMRLEDEQTQAKMDCRVARTSSHLVRQFSTLVSQAMAAAVNVSNFESSPAAKGIEAELIQVTSSILGFYHRPEQNRERRLPRAEILSRSKEVLEQREGERVRIDDLVAATEVSERTLRTVFHEFFGVGPNRYLQLRQLHQIRRALKTADPEATTVADVLIRHGEWEFGRFAARYRRLFAEKPSETLRRKAG